ncbi:MAG: hypothetical protein ACRD4C_15105 [Candidatus Acidiferrales bacterium]
MVRDLEVAGIVGEEVEVVSGAEEEIGPGADLPSESECGKGMGGKIASLFDSLAGARKNEPHDYYVEDLEFYAGELRQGRALVIVRVADEQVANRAASVLRMQGAKSMSGDEGPSVIWERDEPESAPPLAAGGTTSTTGDPGVTTGGTSDDLEGRGQNIRPAKPGRETSR